VRAVGDRRRRGERDLEAACICQARQRIRVREARHLRQPLGTCQREAGVHQEAPERIIGQHLHGNHGVMETQQRWGAVLAIVNK